MGIADYLHDRNLIQFIKFAMVGASNAVVAYILYVVFLLTFEFFGILEDIDYLVAQYISFFLSVVWAYYWNNRYVFDGSEKKWYSKFLKMLLVYSLTGIVLSTALLYLMVDVWGWSKLVAPIINIMIGLPINYLLNKFWTFGERMS